MHDIIGFETPNKHTWCPGCGNITLWKALKTAYAELDLEFEDFAVVWGIGCHGNGADFTRAQGFHALHGRALPAATGLALSNPDLKIIVEMGDGDGYGIGLGHFVHTVRRNIDMTAIVHDNQTYGLTTGQASPTSDRLMQTVSTPHGVLEQPVNALGLALANEATFVARGFAGDVKHLTELVKRAIEHKGFALLDVFQPCVTFNKIDTSAFFRDHVYKLEDEGWDATDRAAAMELSLTTFHELTCTPEECRLPIGVYYEETGTPTYQDGLPQLDRPAWKRAEQPSDVSAALAAFR
jgi:2-oxoglutarate ferredoxin oxidoreductase subunit beta